MHMTGASRRKRRDAPFGRPFPYSGAVAFTRAPSGSLPLSSGRSGSLLRQELVRAQQAAGPTKEEILSIVSAVSSGEARESKRWLRD